VILMGVLVELQKALATVYIYWISWRKAENKRPLFSSEFQ